MDSPFIYDKYVTGKNFIGRRNDCMILGNLISQGEMVSLYEPPKSGKTSLIRQTLFNMRISGRQFMVGELSLLSVRTISSFVTLLASTAIRTVASTPHEYKEIVDNSLAGTHFCFDQRAFSDNDEVVSLNWEIDDNDIYAAVKLPLLLSQQKGQQLIMIIDEFQNICKTEDGDRVLKIMEKVIAEIIATAGPRCEYIFCGSSVNAMADIFDNRRFFYRQVTRFRMSPVDEREIIEHIVKGFLSSGKVIERELLIGVCRMFRNDMWRINHFISICDSMSKGYIVEATLMDALGCILAIHEPKFIATVDNLTTFQLSLLRAILDGHLKFSTAEVIQQYGLNSSANVKRLKDALMKKEIIVFNEKDEPYMADPLFEYWIRSYYFGMKD